MRMKYEKHPSGKTIMYDDRYHVYYVQGMPNLKFISGTQLIKKYFPEFDKMKVSELYARKHGLNQNEVLRGWEEKGRKARERGNKYHSYAEKLLKNNYSIINPKDEVMRIIERKFKSLFKNGFKPVCSECIVASLDLQVAGMVDLMMRKKDTLLISDWKFTEQIRKNNPWEKAFSPIDNFPNAEYYKYSLQLNLYKYIIQKEKYFPNINEYCLELFHINNGINIIKVPDYTIYIKKIIADYENRKN